jgi:hypothetical protein
MASLLFVALIGDLILLPAILASRLGVYFSPGVHRNAGKPTPPPAST